MNTPPSFFKPSEEILKTRNRLPHWQQQGATYSVTFRMADSVPVFLRHRWEEERAIWLKFHPEPWDEKTEREYHQRFTAAMQRWLDAGYGSCLLHRPEASALVAGALAFFDRDRYWNHSWVVMPNHVHVVLTLHAERSLEDILHSWKSYTAHQLVKRFPAAPNPFWQRDYFDRMVRDAGHFARCIRYIRQNPVKANLGDGQYRLYEKGAVASRHRLFSMGGETPPLPFLHGRRDAAPPKKSNSPVHIPLPPVICRCRGTSGIDPIALPEPRQQPTTAP